MPHAHSQNLKHVMFQSLFKVLMLFRAFAISSIALISPCLADVHAAPSSLLQLTNMAQEKTDKVSPESVLSMINKQVGDFQAKMAAEIVDDKEEVRKLQEQQRKMEREEKAFKAKIFAHPAPSSSFAQGATAHFGDPFIDEAMRTIGDDLEAQKHELEGVMATHPVTSFAESQPSLGVIQSALRSRLAMAGK